MSTKSTPSKEELLKTLEALEKNPKSKEKLFGDIGIIGIGSALGAAAAGTIAAATGATAIVGLTTAASWLGVSLVAATPVGWIAGIAVLGGATVFGISRLISGGARTEENWKHQKEQIKERIKDIAKKEASSSISDDDRTKFHLFLKKPLENDLITAEQAHKLMSGVEEGKIKLSMAYQLVEKILKSTE